MHPQRPVAPRQDLWHSLFAPLEHFADSLHGLRILSMF
jgi:hypothetical protein